jgi:hypothetical protein
LTTNVKSGVWKIDFKNDIIIREYLCPAVIFVTGVTHLRLMLQKNTRQYDSVHTGNIN